MLVIEGLAIVFNNDKIPEGNLVRYVIVIAIDIIMHGLSCESLV